MKDSIPGRILKIVYTLWLSLSILSLDLVSADDFGILGHWNVGQATTEHSLLKQTAEGPSVFRLRKLSEGRYSIERCSNDWDLGYFALANEAMTEISHILWIGRGNDARRELNINPRWSMLCLLKVDTPNNEVLPKIWVPYLHWRKTLAGARGAPFEGSNESESTEYVIEAAP